MPRFKIFALINNIWRYSVHVPLSLLLSLEGSDNSQRSLYFCNYSKCPQNARAIVSVSVSVSVPVQTGTSL
jgi:hypothetical protein